jgi:hypothetical protein
LGFHWPEHTNAGLSEPLARQILRNFDEYSDNLDEPELAVVTRFFPIFPDSTLFERKAG